MIHLLEASHLSKPLLLILSNASDYNIALAGFTTAIAFLVGVLHAMSYLRDSVTLSVGVICFLGTVLIIVLSYTPLRSVVYTYLSRKLFSRILNDEQLSLKLRKLLAKLHIEDNDIILFLKDNLPYWYEGEKSQLVKELVHAFEKYKSKMEGSNGAMANN